MKPSKNPLLSVLVAVHDGGAYLRPALHSVLRQSVDDLELLVVNDASTDETAEVLAGIADQRLRVLSNDRRVGLAGSLNRGLEEARGRYVARLDADDVAFPQYLEHVVRRLRRTPKVVIVGAGVLEIGADGTPGRRHLQPLGARAVRWQALFGAPFFHNTVVLEREFLERHGLRYDPRFLESEDYELWTRVLAHGDGDNVPEPLVLLRIHPGQASKRRHDLQLSFQRQVALGQILALAPELAEDAELAWSVGSGWGGPAARDPRAAAAFRTLLDRFEARDGRDRGVRDSASRRLLRAGAPWGMVLEVAPDLPIRVPAERVPRVVDEWTTGRRASRWLRELTRPQAGKIRVAVVSPEPTPYRSPLFDLIAARPEVELTVIYAAETVAERTWSIELRHVAVFLGGFSLPGVRKLFHHEYPVTPGIARELRRARPDVVVASGWSTFSSQAAVLWSRKNDVPYLLLVESHDLGVRTGWRRAVHHAYVPRLVRNAAGILVLGSAARTAMLARGAEPGRVRIFANTVDVESRIERATELEARRAELREELGLSESDIIVLSVARLGAEKGLDTLIEAVGRLDVPGVAVLLVGDGPRRRSLEDLARKRGVRLVLTGNLPWPRVEEAYCAADVFALLSRRETWGVVVNEAAASGLPLVLSDQVGAAYDLLRHGENGFLVGVADAGAAAGALHTLASDKALRRRFCLRSRELVRDWGYEPSVENFVAAVREALTVR